MYASGPISNAPGLVEVFGTTIEERPLAIRINAGGQKAWLPKSRIEDWPDLYCHGSILIPRWLAFDKGLI